MHLRYQIAAGLTAPMCNRQAWDTIQSIVWPASPPQDLYSSYSWCLNSLSCRHWPYAAAGAPIARCTSADKRAASLLKYCSKAPGRASHINTSIYHAAGVRRLSWAVPALHMHQSWKNLFIFSSQIENAHKSNILFAHGFELGSTRPSLLQCQILRFLAPNLAHLKGSPL